MSSDISTSIRSRIITARMSGSAVTSSNIRRRAGRSASKNAPRINETTRSVWMSRNPPVQPEVPSPGRTLEAGRGQHLLRPQPRMG